jgi:hypothetical protein
MSEALVFDATIRFTRRGQLQEEIGEYSLSVEVAAYLKDAHTEPGKVAGQRALYHIRDAMNITWKDLVFYIIVERGVPAADLLEEIRTQMNNIDSDFILCCESRRREILQ